MIYKLLISLLVIGVQYQMFASTPVGQRSEFPPVAPKNQKLLHAEFKKRTRPVVDFAAPPQLDLGDGKKTTSDSYVSDGHKYQAVD